MSVKFELLRKQEQSSTNKDLNKIFQYFTPFVKEGTRSYMANVETNIGVVRTSTKYFPVTINDEQYDSSYVCSPYNMLVTYAKEEASKIDNYFLRALINLLLLILGGTFKLFKINKVVCLNNWLLSTNIYPDWTGEDIDKITSHITKSYPSHAVKFRSLNNYTNNELILNFKKNGYIAFPSRRVYMFKKCGEYMRRSNAKADFKLLNSTNYCIVNHSDISSRDYKRIHELYNLLYLDKYSYSNPQFTHLLIENWHKNKLLTFIGLRNSEGVLDGVIGCFENDEICTVPLVGYDTSISQNRGLYRMLMSLAMRHSLNGKKILNLSSGASLFKRLRGGEPEIEYSMVYIKHLSIYRQFIWKLLSFVLQRVGLPIMRRYKL